MQPVTSYKMTHVNWRADISLKRVLSLLFIIASFYWWVIIPIVREILYFTDGREIAASVSTSLFLLTPMDVFYLEPEKVPSGLWAFLLYYIQPIGELVAFLSTFLAAFYIRQRMNGFARFVIYLGIICAATILLSLLRGDWGYGFFPFCASISGIGVAKLTLRSNLSQPIPDTRTP
jgi:hypothetical protein